MDPVGPVRLSKTTWFRTQWVPINQPMAATITVSDTVQSGTGYISNNYQQPLQSRRKARRLTGPPGLAIPHPDSIGRVSPSKTLKPTLALQK
jgi:hypothetical protein